jgi:hypothetical protein
VINSQERDASKPTCCAKTMCSSSLFCKWLEVLTTIVGHIQKQHISNVLHQDNSKQQKLLHKKAKDAMDWKQKYIPVRERELTCLQNFKSKKERINFSLNGIATNKKTRKNTFNEEVSRMVNQTENFLSSLLFSSCAVLIFAPQQIQSFSLPQKVKLCGAPNPNPKNLLGGQEEGAVGG